MTSKEDMGFAALTVQGRDHLHGTRGQLVGLGPSFSVPLRFDRDCPPGLWFLVPNTIRLFSARDTSP